MLFFAYFKPFVLGPGDAFGKRLSTEEKGERSIYDVEACSFGAIHSISCDSVRAALELYPEEYHKLKYDLVLSFDITQQVKNNIPYFHQNSLPLYFAPFNFRPP